MMGILEVEFPQPATITVLAKTARSMPGTVIQCAGREMVVRAESPVGIYMPLQVVFGRYMALSEVLEEEVTPEGVVIVAAIAHLLDLERAPVHSRFWS
jgi:hypothetical protein